MEKSPRHKDVDLLIQFITLFIDKASRKVEKVDKNNRNCFIYNLSRTKKYIKMNLTQ